MTAELAVSTLRDAVALRDPSTRSCIPIGFIERIYNRRRRYLGQLTPIGFETQNKSAHAA